MTKAHPKKELTVVDADKGVEPPKIEADTHYLLDPKDDGQITLVMKTTAGDVRYNLPYTHTIQDDTLMYDVPHVVTIVPKRAVDVSGIFLHVEIRGLHKLTQTVHNGNFTAQAGQRINITFNQAVAGIYRK